MVFLKKKQSEAEVLRIPLERIRPSRHQPRRFFGEEALSHLADSIRRYGVLQPISVRALSDGYEIIAGERRFRAAHMAGLSQIPCIVYTVDSERSSLLAIVENLLREDLNMFETAAAMDKLCREYGLTQEEVAERLSVSQSYVANKIRLLRFDAEMQERMLSANLTERHARAVLRLPPLLWGKALDQIIAHRANVETAERMIGEMLAAEKELQKPKRAKPRGVLRDVRLFYNSVDRAVALLRSCGIGARTERKEEEGESCLIIHIPKT